MEGGDCLVCVGEVDEVRSGLLCMADIHVRSCCRVEARSIVFLDMRESRRAKAVKLG